MTSLFPVSEKLISSQITCFTGISSIPKLKEIFQQAISFYISQCTADVNRHGTSQPGTISSLGVGQRLCHVCRAIWHILSLTSKSDQLLKMLLFSAVQQMLCTSAERDSSLKIPIVVWAFIEKLQVWVIKQRPVLKKSRNAQQERLISRSLPKIIVVWMEWIVIFRNVHWNVEHYSVLERKIFILFINAIVIVLGN